MKINEDLSILFWLKREKGTKDGRVPIYVRITVKNGKPDGFSSGKKIHPDFWDAKTGPDRACPDYQFINSYLTKTKADLEKCYNPLTASHKKITAAMVKDGYLPKTASKMTLYF